MPSAKVSSRASPGSSVTFSKARSSRSGPGHGRAGMADVDLHDTAAAPVARVGDAHPDLGDLPGPIGAGATGVATRPRRVAQAEPERERRLDHRASYQRCPVNTPSG